MGQICFSESESDGKRKETRREVFLEEMELVVPRRAPMGLVEPHYPLAGRGRRPHPLGWMLRAHLMQNWYSLADLAMEEALCEIACLRTFAQLSLGEPIPNDTTILIFRLLLEANELTDDILKTVDANLAIKGLLLKRGSIVDETFIAAPSSTRNTDGEPDPDMHQTEKGDHWQFGMKARIAGDADSGQVHAVITAAANEADVEQIADLPRGMEEHVWAESGHRGAQGRAARDALQWYLGARPSDIAKLPEGRSKQRLKKQEQKQASVRAKVEQSFRIIKRQFCLAKIRFRGLTTDAVHVVSLFALPKLWSAQTQPMAMGGAVRALTA